MQKKEINKTVEKKETAPFVKEVAKYFMNFLETDFKKRRIPKRNTIQKTQKGLRVGIDLDKYPKLKKQLLSNFNSGLEKSQIQIKKGDFTNNIPDSLYGLLKERIKKITPKNLNAVIEKVSTVAKENILLYPKEYDKYLEETKEKTKDIFSKIFISPLLNDLDKPLENLQLADENSKYQLELEIIDFLFSLFEEKYSDILQAFYHDPVVYNFSENFYDIIKLPEIKDGLVNFFENFIIGDAFFDIYQLFRNSQLIDKTELYLYFYELSLDDEKFPIFYLPITIEKQEDKFIFIFEKRLFVNLKAIEFVAQEYSSQMQSQSTLAGEFDRIIYINGEEKFINKIEQLVRKIEDFFELNKNVDITNSEPQRGVNLITSFSNKTYLYLFDKSDEALINDYEAILNDNGEIIEDFSSLLNRFIQENPVPFMEEISDEWHEKDITEKLIVESPVPLNDEQKQVLMALQKPDCRIMILEGPPGTGKSHTITAIICKALLEEKSVLVLSDKKEALDVVEDKISETLNKVRHEDDFQNPILRLGKTGNKFYKIVQGQTIAKIKEHYQAYRYKKNEYENSRQESIIILSNNIKENISYFNDINIKDIEYYFGNIQDNLKINWVNNDFHPSLNEKFLKIRQIIKDLGAFKHCNFNTSFISKENLDFITIFKDHLKELEITKELLGDARGDINFIKILEVISKENRIKLEKHLQIIDKINISLNSKEKMKLEIEALLPFNRNILYSVLIKRQELISEAFEIYNSSKKYFYNNLSHLGILNNFVVLESDDVRDIIFKLEKFINDLANLRAPIVGYFFKKEKLIDLKREIKKTFPYFNIEFPEKNIKILNDVLDLYVFIEKKLSKNSDSKKTFLMVTWLLMKCGDKSLINYCNDYFEQISLVVESVNKIGKMFPINDFKISDNKKLLSLLNYLDIVEKTNNIYSKINSNPNSVLADKMSLSDDQLKYSSLNKEIVIIESLIEALNELIKVKDDISFLENFQKQHQIIADRICLNIDSIDKISCDLLNYSNKKITEYLKFKETEKKLDKQFNAQPQDKFFESLSEIENLTTLRLAHFLDERIINYTANDPQGVQTLRTIIKRKEQFKKGLFGNLKKAFPCILAGIRDYAEFIPLEKDLFDLIVIDEASQVSIAQALPALIRGKQIIVLGDDKQFSNVKANNASKVTNQILRKKVQDIFKDNYINGEDDCGWLSKVKENFDIKNSILKFSRFIRNYECQLKKHFRCYPEIISYSNKYFYENSLQCMKIRGKNIDEVIKFDVIKHDGKLDSTKNTNELEVKFIIEKLIEFKNNNIEQSLGIITPHREQVKLLFDKINELTERDWLFDAKRKLKIMTFDTCQGEERDYIFYSMVATEEKDQLNWIFPVSQPDTDFNLSTLALSGNVKAQRLNVGFSRAKECMHFVLSKEPAKFYNEVKNALFHYINEREIAHKRIVKELDSKMEYKVDQIFHDTKFYKDNKEKIVFIPQFEIGKYLKQLERDYNHPSYKVDFLLIFGIYKIVIEYDGFREHFTDLDEVNESNYKYYMKESDMYRQKILEGYGYKFLRINRFNIGKDPVETLNSRLENLVKKNFKTG